MISILKKLYFGLAAPLSRRLNADLTARLGDDDAERVAHAQSIRWLHQELDLLKKRVEVQNLYIDNLRKAGLHGLLSQYLASEMRSPKVVIAALSDITGGMEPSAVSVKHKIPTDELIAWAETFAANSRQKAELNRVSTSTSIDGEDFSGLLERQLEFNTRIYRDREEAAALEIARLNEELALERHANNALSPVK